MKGEEGMKIIIWGSRGSLPAPFNERGIRAKIRAALRAARDETLASEEAIDHFIDTRLPFAVKGGYGSNTSCVQIEAGREFIILDAGTGLRDLGNHMMRCATGPLDVHIFLSHLHWDHIQGFPFFVPAFVKGNHVTLYGFHEGIEDAFAMQQKSPFFPVPLASMEADIRFVRLEPGKVYEVAGVSVTGKEQHHPGISYGYRISRDGKTVVYSTDSEHRKGDLNSFGEFLDFYRTADLLIFDAQYSLKDVIDVKENWGHSSNMIGVELAVAAGVKHLCLYHTEPTDDDERLDALLQETKRYAEIMADDYPLQISVAYDGMKVEI